MRLGGLYKGGLYINGERVLDVNHIIKLDGEVVIKLGKRKFVKIVSG